MKNKRLIIILSTLAVIICLILSALLFYSISVSFLIIMSFTIGIVSGVCGTMLIMNLSNALRNKRLNNEN
jgi:hypothetical protein